MLSHLSFSVYVFVCLSLSLLPGLQDGEQVMWLRLYLYSSSQSCSDVYVLWVLADLLCVVCPLPGLHGWEEVAWLRFNLAAPQDAHLSAWIHILHILFVQSTYQKCYAIMCSYCDSVGLFCTRIYCVSVFPWPVIPEVSSIVFSFPFERFFLTRNESLRTEVVVRCTAHQAPWGKLW